MRLEPFEIEGKVVVLGHAIEKARVRDPRAHAELSNGQVGDLIAAGVRDGIERGRVYDERPRGFRITDRSRALPPGQRIVLGQNHDVGWIVSLDQPPDVMVVTTVSKLINTQKGRTHE